MKYLYSLIIFITLHCISCGTSAPIKQELYYFDLNTYFNAQANALNKANPSVKKAITKNGETEEKVVDNINWEQELLGFSESDINKPSWKDAYTTDTLIELNGYTISHEAKDKNLITRLISINFDNNNAVNRIEIRKQPDKKIYFANTTLLYIPDSTYSVFTEQNLVLFDKDVFTVTATLIK